MRNHITIPSDTGAPVTLDFKADPLRYIPCTPQPGNSDSVSQKVVDLRERRQQWRRK